MSREDERRQAELDKMAADKEAIALADKYESLDESDRPADFVRLIGVLRNPDQAYAVGGRTGYNQLPMSASEEAKKISDRQREARDRLFNLGEIPLINV